MIYLIAVASSFCAVFLKVFQQQNVIGRHVKMAAATSYVIAFFDVVVVMVIIQGGWWTFLLTGTGGAAGVVCSMLAHGRLFRR